MFFVFLFLLVAACVLIHGVGMVIGLELLAPAWARLERRFTAVHASWLLIRIVFGLLLLHLTQILVWAAFFQAHGCFDGFETAFYFSATSYSTVGYGDVMPPAEWRTMGAVEAVTGILMFGWSTGALFTFVSRLQIALIRSGRHTGRPPG